MGKFDGILICSDIDGTLTLEKDSIPKENCEALEYFMENGGLFSVATGRFPNYFEKFAKCIVPNAPTLGLNGTVIYDQREKKVLCDYPFEGEGAGYIFDTLEKYRELTMGYAHCKGGISYFVERENGAYVVKKVDMRGEKTVFVDGFCKPVSEKSEILKIFREENAVIYKIAVRVHADDSDRIFAKIKKEFSDYNVFRSWINGIEIQSAKADKGKGALLLAKKLKDVKLLVCVGDYENDTDMIKAADIGYAVGNACDEAKAAADRITVHCNDFAIAAIVKDLENMQDSLHFGDNKTKTQKV